MVEILEMHDCMEAGSRTTHDYRDVGGKVTPGAVSEEIKSRIQFPVRHQISKIQTISNHTKSSDVHDALTASIRDGCA